uniref:Sulfate_transp domain-containing protein n=1 Tax=Heterorhabditis bacteriophora TaxID=37862 RepID=A0A1I7W9K2_HETBA
MSRICLRDNRLLFPFNNYQSDIDYCYCMRVFPSSCASYTVRCPYFYKVAIVAIPSCLVGPSSISKVIVSSIVKPIIIMPIFWWLISRTTPIAMAVPRKTKSHKYLSFSSLYTVLAKRFMRQTNSKIDSLAFLVAPISALCAFISLTNSSLISEDQQYLSLSLYFVLPGKKNSWFVNHYLSFLAGDQAATISAIAITVVLVRDNLLRGSFRLPEKKRFTRVHFLSAKQRKRTNRDLHIVTILLPVLVFSCHAGL